MASPGHLFITHGDLTSLACDAWLLPTDRSFDIEKNWWVAMTDARYPEMSVAGRTWADGQPVQSFCRHPTFGTEVWLGMVGGYDVHHFAAVGAKFVVAASKALKEHDACATSTWRTQRLIALPVLGSGMAGSAHEVDAILSALVPALIAAAATSKVDVALVAHDAAMATAAQRVRKRHVGDGCWADLLGSTAKRAADRLAGYAGSGDLVLFLGAGVSVGAGLPGWNDLLCQLAGPDQERLSAGFKKMNVMDQATLVARWMEVKTSGSASVGQRIADMLKPRKHVSLVHQLAAALPVTETVTTNYDTLFERASRAVAGEISVLPHAPEREARRWILKLHGCVEKPEDIVLTREHYLRYEQQRAALAGIVQALLITKHMLFIGFSLRDDNFHRVIDAVRRAVGPSRDAGAEPFGTALFVTEDVLAKELWGPDLALVHSGDPVTAGDSEEAVREGARRLEMFLDYLCAQTSTPAFFGRQEFAQLLSKEERALCVSLGDAVRRVEAMSGSMDEQAVKLVKDLAARLGLGRKPGNE